MPRKIYKRRKRTTTKRGGSGRKGYNRRVRIPKMVAVRKKWTAPQIGTRFFKFRYNDDGFDGSTTAGSPQYFHCFSGNGMYDPDVTGVGVQPYYFDQFVNTEMYPYWIVYASKITVYPRVASANGYQKIFLLPAITSGMLANHDPSDLSNTRHCKQIVIDRTTMGGRDGGRKLSSYMSTRRMIYQRNARDSTYQGSSSTNPQTQWYWHVYFDQTHEANDEIYCMYDVKITYYAQLSGSVGNVNES